PCPTRGFGRSPGSPGPSICRSIPSRCLSSEKVRAFFPDYGEVVARVEGPAPVLLPSPSEGRGEKDSRLFRRNSLPQNEFCLIICMTPRSGCQADFPSAGRPTGLPARGERFATAVPPAGGLRALCGPLAQDRQRVDAMSAAAAELANQQMASGGVVT